MATNTQVQPQLEGMPAPTLPVRSHRSDFLPVRPMRRWLRDYVLKVGGMTNAAMALHVHERRLWGILREQSYVSIQVADAILIAADEPHTFYLLYPLDDAAIEPEPGPWSRETGGSWGEAGYERWCLWCVDQVTTNDSAHCPNCKRATPLAEAEGTL